MRRRNFVGLLGASMLCPYAARGQQSPIPVIGFLGTESPGEWQQYVDAFRKGLLEVGYEDGRNVIIEFRWGQGEAGRLDEMTADLVRRNASVIVTSAGTVAARAAKSTGANVPIVFVMGGDPVQLDLVVSLSRPGGTVTGISFLLNALAAKRVQLLGELFPAITLIALLMNPANPNTKADTTAAQQAARDIGRETFVAYANSEDDFEAAVLQALQQGAGALFVGSDVMFLNRRDRLVGLTTRHGLPSIYDRHEFAAAGGLIAYGPKYTEAHRLAGTYAARILNGSNPAEMPVLQPTTFELVINLNTAKALGLTIPLSLIARADEVIE